MAEPRHLAAADTEVVRELVYLEAVTFDSPSPHRRLIRECGEYASGWLWVGWLDAERAVNNRILAAQRHCVRVAHGLSSLSVS
jgi:hypothetical protein